MDDKINEIKNEEENKKLTEIEELAEIISKSKNLVFFGGAGVSTESKIPDFRSVDGLYAQKYKWPPEEILSATFFNEKVDDFYEFYREKMLFLDAKPNSAHVVLAKWEKAWNDLQNEKKKIKEEKYKPENPLPECPKITVITQNIDGLHQKAGSENVYELHGSVLRNYCMKCGKKYDVLDIKNGKGVPKCKCGGTIKPDVVLYEESLNGKILRDSVNAIEHADTLIVAGTSLTVYPAAGLIDYFYGDNLIVINKTPTPRDAKATLCFYAKVGETLAKVDEALDEIRKKAESK